MEAQMTHRMRRLLITAGLCTCTLGCSPGATRFVHPEADLPYYQKIAVMPFEALSNDRLAGEKVTSVFFTEVLRMGFDQVAEPGQLTTAMSRLRGGTPPGNPWSTEDLSKLAEATGVQGFFMGTVRDYDMVPAGRDVYPLLSLEARFVDAATGRVVWSASNTRRGGPPPPFMGWMATRTMGELTMKMCRELLGTLPKAATSDKAAPGEKSTPSEKSGKRAQPKT
jgi:TolB-like protein